MNTIPVLANSISSSIAGVLGMARKVIVVDLDNTIWGGIIGDDGLDGIKLGNDTPEGEAFINFQNYLIEQDFSAFIRQNRATDILGACGQLAASASVTLPTPVGGNV